MAKLRISAISFLNTAPLMWDFEHGDAGAEFEVAYTLPAACAQALQDGTADIGLVPAIACQTIPDLVIIPGISIASRGPVRSIILVSKVEVEKIHSVAVDTSSRTSVALLQILLQKGCFTAATDCRPKPKGTAKSAALPKLVPMEPKLETMLAEHDAALLIGDPALLVDRSGYHIMDLGEVWTNTNSLPFVYAVWAVRKAALAGVDAPTITATFQGSRDHGLMHVEEIAKEWGPRVRLSPSSVKRYLTQNIDYGLGEEHLRGLEMFYSQAQACGILEKTSLLTFLTPR